MTPCLNVYPSESKCVNAQLHRCVSPKPCVLVGLQQLSQLVPQRSPRFPLPHHFVCSTMLVLSPALMEVPGHQNNR